MAATSKPENAPACKRRALPSQDRLKQLLCYDPETGLFTWAVDVICGRGRGHPIVKAGDVAGGVSSAPHTSYVFIGVDGKRFAAHRLAFIYMIGVAPDIVDHIDGNGLNNSWENLRAATKSQNAANSKTPVDNKVGVKGVMRDKHGKKWVAQIKPSGHRSTHLGTFDTIEEASAAYERAARMHFGEFARTE